MLLSPVLRDRPSRQNGSFINSRTVRSKSLTSESDMERDRAWERKQDRREEQELKRDYDRSWKRRSHDSERDHIRGNDGDSRYDMVILNKEFKNNIIRLENSICSMNFVEKSVATEWITKLKTDQPNINEARARNLILSYLLKCINQNVFNREPFNKPPPPITLSSIKETMNLTQDTVCMAATSNDQGKRKYLSELFNDSYDGGDFLSQLPVPRDGAFFVLHLRPNLK